METSDLLIGALALIRLFGSLGTGVLAIQDRRWIILGWAILGVVLSLPVAAISLGHEIATLPLIAIVAGHALQTIFVGGATLSSRGEVRRLREVLTTAGLDPGKGTWRP